MIRKLSLAVAVATALSPLGALALGLGEIHTQSALNQNFKADIDLLSISKDEIQDIRVGLASPEAFAKAGIDRPFLITGLEFTPSLAPDGRIVIVVTSREPIREPFLDFLIEVNWPKGRLVREYTVLLDPPVTLDRRPAPLQAPRVSTSPVRQTAPVQSSQAITASPYTGMATSTGARDYGPIQANDNLWQIAKQLQESGETTEQVMMALQRYNPDAFIRDNVNGLKVGKILRLPEGADVTAVSHREARREFLAQTREWREGRPSAVAAQSTKPVEPQVSTVAEAPKVDRLKLVSAKTDEEQTALDQEGKAEEADEIARLEQEILLVREANESSRQENQALRDQVSKLESQISDIQRLLTLKSDQLTQLQSNQQIVAEKTEALEEAPPVAQEPIAEAMPEVTETMATAPEEALIEEVDIEAVIAEAMQQEQLAAEMPEATEAVMPAEPQPAAPMAEAPMAAAPEPVAKTQPAPQPMPQAADKIGGFLASLRGDTTLMAIVGGVAVLLLTLLWLITRRRKEAEAEFAESILVTPEAGAAVGAVSGGTGSINEPTDETSFMSDFSPSDIDALQDETGEVDPLSEADVYIAYGRYQQAEELIRQAIDRYPQREDLKQKLLEIHYSAKNSSQFSKLAEELKKGGLEEKQPEVWAKIAAMGKELDPGNALFAAAAAGLAIGSAGDELDDLGLNLEGALPDEELTPSAESSSGLASTDLDSMDLSGLDNLDEMDSENLEAELSLDSEFLNSMELERTKTGEGAESLDIDLDEQEAAGDGSLAGSQDDSLNLTSSLDESSEISELDLKDFDLDSEALNDDAVIGIDDSEALDDLDLESLEKELESLSGDLEAKSGLAGEAADSGLPEDADALSEGLDLDSTDEVTTKLDLARAYVDMGDAEGAKGILEEVANEGTDEQKQQARELLDSMSG